MHSAKKINAFLRNDGKTISGIWNDMTQLDAVETNTKVLLFAAGLPLLANKGLATLVEKTETGAQLESDGYVDVFLHDGNASRAFIVGVESIWDRPKKTLTSATNNTVEMDVDELINHLRDGNGSIRAFNKAISSLSPKDIESVEMLIAFTMNDIGKSRTEALKFIRNQLKTLDNDAIKAIIAKL